jgi:uncharacterized membrane protein YvlD (DUF360 family)
MIAGKHAVLVEMINTGWMFMFAKVIEVASGVLLLTNRFVPLILVIAFPVALMTFLLDAMILGDLFGWVMGTVSGDVLRARMLDMVFFGGAVLAMHGYLMLGYLDRYLPMLALKVEPKLP